jgi:serine/threonine protein kinase
VRRAPELTFVLGLKPFQSIPRRAAEELMGRMKRRRFKAGQTILERGGPGDAMYVILDGGVRVRIPGPDGSIRFETRLASGDIFGEMAILTGEPRNADVVVSDKGPCTVLRISRDDLDQLLRDQPGVAFFLTELLDQRLMEGLSLERIGPYRIVDTLGRGGMATVFDGYHPVLQRPVAIKVLSHGLVHRPGFIDRFRKEAKVLAALRHPGIVPVYDAAEGFGTWFIVMERLRGTDLGRVVADDGPFRPTNLRKILLQILRALHYAHEQGIVHRDIKPGNVFLEPTGRIRLMDFGIATEGVEVEDGGPLLCSPEYAPPEVSKGQPVDRRADLYSLGITAFRLLADRVPFKARDPYETLRMHATAPMPDLQEAIPGIPRDLKQFIERCTCKRPEDRFQTCREAQDMLAESAQLASGITQTVPITLYFAAEEVGSARQALEAIRGVVDEFPQIDAHIGEPK